MAAASIDYVSYLLSVSHLNLGRRKAQWAEPDYETRRPIIRDVGIEHAPTDPPGGVVARVGPSGQVERTLRTWVPQGIATFDGRLVVANPWRLTWIADDLDAEAGEFISRRCFSMLHSLRNTSRGLLVASTGVDALVEVDRNGEVVWEWWATEHDYTKDIFGDERVLGRATEHRGLNYDTKLHTTHVNAGAELTSGTVVATLFHQGQLVAIDRGSGRTQVLLDGLVRPHGARVVGPGLVTLADTGHGAALLCETDGGSAQVIERVELDTPWLQDALRLDEIWLLVDGASSRVAFVDRGGSVVREDCFDPEWRLFEVLVA